FTMPLSFIRPERDVPIVPLWTNVMAPPIPPAQRFYNVGLAIRGIVAELPAQLRVAVLASGHMANSVGAPGMLRIRTDPEHARDRVMREVTRDAGAVAASLAETPAYLADRDLTAEERTGLLDGDYATLYRLGAHRCLLWAFTRAVLPNGGPNPQEYTAALLP